jgi:hypothetical protein
MGGEEQTIQVFCLLAFSVFKLVRGLCVVLLKGDFSNIFVKLSSPETLLQGFKRLNLQI